MRAKPIAAILGGAAAIFCIGLFAFIAEYSGAFKALLTISSSIGPLSGKVLFGYLAGLAVFLAATKLLGSKEREPKRSLWLLIILTIISCALVLLPALLKG